MIYIKPFPLSFPKDTSIFMQGYNTHVLRNSFPFQQGQWVMFGEPLVMGKTFFKGRFVYVLPCLPFEKFHDFLLRYSRVVSSAASVSTSTFRRPLHCLPPQYSLPLSR